MALVITEVTDMNVFEPFRLKKFEKSINNIITKGGQMSSIKGEVEVLAYTELNEIFEAIVKDKP